MADGDKNLEMAYSIKEKFELYLVALSLTLLAFSVQTAKFDSGGSIASLVWELFAWLLLVVSSLVGLWRLQYVGPLLSTYAEINRKNALLEQVRQDQQAGKTHIPVDDAPAPVPIAQVLEELGNGIARNEKEAEEMHKWIKRGYAIHMGSLLIGIVSLIVARGLDPARRVWHLLF